MDNFATDDEKLCNIRETIRQVILPLVQVIYLEEPSDVPCFCAEYFQSILQKRESSDKKTDERGSNAMSDEQFASTDGDLPPPKSNEETKEMIDTAKCNIQGSASLPTLTTDKRSEGLIVRESSSWNEQSMNLPDRKSSVACCSLVDAVIGIGDQPHSLIRKSEGTEMKEGDNAFLKNENGREFSDKNGGENQHMIHIKQDSPAEEHASCIIPSAPPYDDDKRVNYVNSVLLFPHTNQVSFDLREKQSDSEDVNEHSKILSEDSENSSYVKNVIPDKEQGIKICRGVLSPNSSFGFIPHLQDVKLEEEKQKAHYCEESDHREESAREIEKLTQQFSKTFTELADELESAESHLNEYLKVKEISDIIQGKDRMRESSTDATFVRVSDVENETSNEMEEPVKKKANSNETAFVETTGECECMEYSGRSSQNLNAAGEINNCCANEELCLRDDNILETNKDCQESERDNKSEIVNLEHDKDLEVNNPIPSQSNTVEEEDRFNSHLTIDENWKRRWYEVHPRLDNASYSFQQRVPPVRRARSVSFSSHRNQIIHNVSEAGDVPIDRRYHEVQDEARERLDCSCESHLDATSFSSSLDTGTLNSHGILSDDGIYHSKTDGMTTHSFSNRSGMNTNTGISSQSIPYSWRLMISKQSASPDQNKGRILKSPELKLEKDISDNTKCSELNPKGSSTASYEVESLQEDTTVEETEDEGSADSHRSHKLMPDSGCNESDDAKIDEELNISEEKFAKVATIIEKGPHSPAINDQELDDTKNKPCRNAAIENLTTNKSYSQVTQFDQAFASEPEHFYDTHEQFEDSPQKISPEKHSNEETVLCEDYYAKKASKEYLNCTEKGDEGAEIKATDSNLTPLEKTEESNACQISESSVKEPGLNSACGDFEQSIATENMNCNINPSDINSADVSNSSLTVPNPTAGSIQEITAEYFERIMGRILEQQNELLKEDDYEGLNFSSDSGTESSNLEEPSDISETDDKI